jgi:hypothetical protein
MKPHANPKWADRSGAFSPAIYQQRWRATRRGNLTNLYNQATWKARKAGDKEMLTALEAALKDADGKKWRINVDRIKLRLQRWCYRQRPEGLWRAVPRKIAAAKRAGLPEASVLTAQELRWLKAKRLTDRQHARQPDVKRRIAESSRRSVRRIKRQHPKRYARMRTYDNALQRSIRIGDLRAETALRAAHLKAGCAWKVDCRAVWRSLGRTPKFRRNK